VVEPHYSYQEDYPGVRDHKDFIRITVKRPTKTNVLKTLTYPLVKFKQSLRQLIIVVAIKVEEPKVEVIARW
jgi:hypothetical protein